MQLEPRVVVCAWCELHGRALAAIRPVDNRFWITVSHDFAHAAAQAGLASHGICAECFDREVQNVEAPHAAVAV